MHERVFSKKISLCMHFKQKHVHKHLMKSNYIYFSHFSFLGVNLINLIFQKIFCNSHRIGSWYSVCFSWLEFCQPWCFQKRCKVGLQKLLTNKKINIFKLNVNLIKKNRNNVMSLYNDHLWNSKTVVVVDRKSLLRGTYMFWNRKRDQIQWTSGCYLLVVINSGLTVYIVTFLCIKKIKEYYPYF